MIKNLMLVRRSVLQVMAAVAAVAVVASLPGCGKNVDHEPTKITIVGSSTIAPLMGEIAKAYEKFTPDFRIDVQAGGSARGVAEARQGTALIGMVSRELKPDEAAELHHVLIAKDGLAMIVNKSNSIKALSRDQVVGIYSRLNMVLRFVSSRLTTMCRVQLRSPVATTR
jgi:phosphate transport system substrate-binding protein